MTKRYIAQIVLREVTDEGDLLEVVDTWTAQYSIADENQTRTFCEEAISRLNGQIAAAKPYRKEIVEREPRFRKE